MKLEETLCHRLLILIIMITFQNNILWLSVGKIWRHVLYMFRSSCFFSSLALGNCESLYLYPPGTEQAVTFLTGKVGFRCLPCRCLYKASTGPVCELTNVPIRALPSQGKSSTSVLVSGSRWKYVRH